MQSFHIKNKWYIEQPLCIERSNHYYVIFLEELRKPTKNSGCLGRESKFPKTVKNRYRLTRFLLDLTLTSYLSVRE
jgi:hypothetical protein